jgi:hypothetical protein
MKYTPVFTIEVIHEYYSASKPSMFNIIPTSETIAKLSGAGLVSKFLKNKLYVFAKHINHDAPLLQISNDLQLHFFLEVTDPDFQNITNYKAMDSYNRKLYFSNELSLIDQNDKSIDGKLYLHEKLALFSNVNSYKYNDIVRSASDNAYECLANIAANTGNLNNKNQFRALGKVSYVTPRTSILFSGPNKIIPLIIPSDSLITRYFKYNSVSKLYDIEIKATEIGPEQNPNGEILTSASINFSTDDGRLFPEGIYRVSINAQEVFIYFRPTNDWQPYNGLININCAANVPSNYKFIKDDGSFFLIPPQNQEVDTRNYFISFAPSQYLLKYICKSNKVENILDEAGNIEFDNLGANVFQSKLPVRTSEKALDTIAVQYQGSDLLKKTKLPGYRNLSVTNDDNQYLVSETFLNL